MFTLTVRDHMMVAHSLPHPSFGPAQQLHGATYVVELTVWRETLGPESTVIDIGEVAGLLKEVLSDLTYRNLDEHLVLVGAPATTETLARFVAERVAGRLAGRRLDRLEVILREHPDAWAGYVMALD